ncbi:LOW QUALITY PROTEIN: hypothetical protein Cgig2_006601 [Carnegiea gigantea]|uniref:Uncharacterized protein n=1 Tax=Carnegiea gigantea TaxID=171969 RepID=A0A9Q1KQD3_9CARY|nr:LOW QUALITY PROTEIN: hypothetical protein Cgig2_006601 [Carnegiea gigantea]
MFLKDKEAGGREKKIREKPVKRFPVTRFNPPMLKLFACVYYTLYKSGEGLRPVILAKVVLKVLVVALSSEVGSPKGFWLVSIIPVGNVSPTNCAVHKTKVIFPLRLLLNGCYETLPVVKTVLISLHGFTRRLLHCVHQLEGPTSTGGDKRTDVMPRLRHNLHKRQPILV